MYAELARQAGEKEGAAYVGEKSDVGLRVCHFAHVYEHAAHAAFVREERIRC